MNKVGFERSFFLTNEEIDAYSDQLGEALVQAGIEKENRIRLRLSFEEALLRMQERYGEEAEVFASFRLHLRRYVILLEHEGAPFNPLSKAETEVEDLCGSILTSVGLSPHYTFTGRKNVLQVAIPKQGINPVLQIVIALAGGVLFGLAGKAILSLAMQEAFIDGFLHPVFEAWARALNVISGPVVFFMVISTVISMNSIGKLGGSNTRVTVRYFLISFTVTLFALIMAMPLFRPGVVPSAAGSVDLLEILFAIIPEEALSPFMESNTPQLLMLAFVLAAAVNFLGDETANLKRLLKQANKVGLQITEWISFLAPFLLFFIVMLAILNNSWRQLAGLIPAIIFSILVGVVCMAIALVHMSVRQKCGIGLLIRKLKEPFLTTIRFGSLSASYGQAERCCVRQLGIPASFTQVALPQGLVLYMPASVISAIILVLLEAKRASVVITPAWLVVAVLLSVILIVATPPAPGANLIAYTAIFVNLGIPSDYLIDALVFDIIVGISYNAVNQAMLQIELIGQADRLGILNHKTLQKEG